MTFQVGQRVRFKTEKEFGDSIYEVVDDIGWVDGMNYLFGCEATVVNVRGTVVELRDIDTDGDADWHFNTSMIVPLFKRGDKIRVSDDGVTRYSRTYLATVIGCKEPYLTVSNLTLLEYERGEEFNVTMYKYAKPEKVKMTLEQVCKELGRDIEII